MSDLRESRRLRCAPAVLVLLVAWATSAIAQKPYAPQPDWSRSQAFEGSSRLEPGSDSAGYFPGTQPERLPRNSSRRQASHARLREQPANPGYSAYDVPQPQRLHPRRPPRLSPDLPRSSARPAHGTDQPTVYTEVPGTGAVQQVEWQQENECACACQCEGKACYSGQCSHCTERWSLFPEWERFKLGGWIQQGVTFNFNAPEDRSNTRVFFNDRSNDYLLNQVYFYAEAPICNDGSHWDVGGRVDVNYGRDSRFITVPGLERHRDRTPKWNGEDELYGLAVPQAYFEVAAPWLKGVSLKAGHFYSTMGYERVAAPDNFFYSHSYSLIFGEPFTFTGALATIKPTDRLTFNAGYTSGWDVWDSTSNEWGVLAGVRWGTTDGRTSIGVQVHTGADVTGVRIGNALVEEGRTAWTLVFKHCLTERLRYVFQHDFGQQADGRIIATIPTSTISFGTAKWYSINQYLFYEHNKKLTSGLRVEWFRDQDKSRTAVPVVFNPGGPVLNGGNYLAVTGGVNWKPQANVIVRPELRWDWSDLKGNPNVPGGDPTVRTFVDGTRNSQFTAALDVIIHF